MRCGPWWRYLSSLDSQHIYYIQGKQGSVQLILVGYPRSGVEWSTGMKKLLVKSSAGIAAKLRSAGTQKPCFSKHPSLRQQGHSGTQGAFTPYRLVSNYCLRVNLNGFSITRFLLWLCSHTLTAHSAWISSEDPKRHT